jgi:hypothetical protein
MKVYAGYDEAGNILTLAIPTDEVKEGEMALDPEPGQYASEFEVHRPSGTTSHELMRDLFKNYRVERIPSSGARLSTPARLVRRDEAASKE